VGSLMPNAWGIYDMHGNVAEFCRDWYADYDGKAETDPKGPEDKPRTQQHVVRGGAWRSYAGACRSACRLRSEANRRCNHLGIRLVCTLPARPEAGDKDGRTERRLRGIFILSRERGAVDTPAR
jgi:formylglycine-generating enzyme required for sulfatase activity